MDSQTLSSMDTDQKQLINLMIFEHACKHNMEGIIKHAIKDEEFLQILQPNTIKNSATLKIRPIFFFMAILKKFICSLENSLTNQTDDMFLWNKNLLDLLINLLLSTYLQFNFLSLKGFTTLISQLKLLVLIRMLAEDISGKLIVQKLNVFFPRWTTSFESSIKKQFNIKNLKKLKIIQDSHTQCRKMILRFTASHTCRDAYIANKCTSDLKLFITDCIFYLKQTIISIEENAGLSEIEKLIDESEKNLSQFDDPAMQIFLEYLHLDMKEEDFFDLLHALEPNLESQPDASLYTCLRPMDIFSDTCSELMSEQGCSDVDDVEGEGDEEENGNFESASDREHSPNTSVLDRTVVELTVENLQKATTEQAASNSSRKSSYETALTQSKSEEMEVEDFDGEAILAGSALHNIFS